MPTKLNCILLVDDDRSCNFLHKRLLDKSGIVKHVSVSQTAAAALDFLRNIHLTPEHPGTPDIIFLDINMPGMNGWDFLEEYRKLDEPKKNLIVLIMLTSSLNPDDKIRAESYPEVNGIEYKLLDKEKLQRVLKSYFPEVQLPVN